MKGENQILEQDEAGDAKEVRSRVILEIFQLQKGNLSIAEYTCKFEFLMLKYDIKELEPQTIARYIGGLKESITDVIRLLPYWTFNDV